MKHIFASRAAMTATASSSLESSVTNTYLATSKPHSPIRNPLSTVTPCPIGKFMENPYCSYTNIFLFTIYIILAVLGVGFALWAIFTFLKKDMEKYAAELQRQQQLRRERRSLADDLLRGLIGAMRARLDEEAGRLGDETPNPSYGGTTFTTVLPRRRRSGVGEAEIGSPEEGTIAQRRSRRQGPSVLVARSVVAVVEEEEEEREEQEVERWEEDRGEMRFEDLVK